MNDFSFAPYILRKIEKSISIDQNVEEIDDECLKEGERKDAVRGESLLLLKPEVNEEVKI